MVQESQSRRVSFLLDNLAGGGAEKVILNLASGFARLGHPVDVLVCKMEGPLCDKIPENVNLVQLKASSSLRGFFYALVVDPASFRYVVKMFIQARKLPGTFRFMPAVVDYLKTSHPAGLLSALPRANINAVLAKRCSGESTRVIVGVHVNYSVQEHEDQGDNKPGVGYMQAFVRRYYRQADAVVAVSKGVADDISKYLRLPRDRVTAIYNPIATREVQALARENTNHPWFESGNVPVILGIGRFVTQKNFPLLLRAFARVREKLPARLVLLGGDESSAEQCLQQKELAELAERLGVRDDFDMPGFVDNPFSYMRKAALFVLSSRWEGFGNVLVEALLCGCPVVSTNCPSGPTEILADGKYGRLVPIDDEGELADAICWTLDNPPDKEFLRARGEEFSVDNAVECYHRLIFDIHV
jgi:glycosyltransferase involved in cell wall biosynthesis